MRLTRIAATLVLAFLLGGGAAELALDTRQAIVRHRAAHGEGSAGELVSFEIRDPGGRLLGRPRVIVPPGRTAEVILRDADEPDLVRVALRIETERLVSGDLLLGYTLHIPDERVATSGRVSVTPGVEQEIDLGDEPVVATVFTIPVPSAAFDAYLDANPDAAGAVVTRM